jgi:hypothetical protein
MQPDLHLVRAHRLDRLGEVDVAAVDLLALGRQRLGDVQRGDEPKSLSCSPTLRAIVTETALIRLACSSALPRSLALTGGDDRAVVLELLDVGLVGQDRELPGQEVVPAEAGLDVDQLTRAAHVGNVLAQDDLHRHGVLLSHQRVVRDEGQAAGALDGHRHLTLVLGAVPRDPPGMIFPRSVTKYFSIAWSLKSGWLPFSAQKRADLLAAEAAPSARFSSSPPGPPRRPSRRRRPKPPPKRTAATTARPITAGPVSVSVLSGHVLLSPGWPSQASSGASSSKPSSVDAVPRRAGALRSRTAGLVHVAGQLHVVLDGAGLGVDVVRHLHAEPAGDLVEVPEVALHLGDQGLPAEVRGVDVDGPGLLGHREHGLLLAPHREADQLAALAVDDAADALLHAVHALVGEVGLDQEDGLVLAQVMRGALLCHVFLPLGLCPGSSARSGDAVSGRLPARPPGTGKPRARRPRAAAKERAG